MPAQCYCPVTARPCFIPGLPRSPARNGGPARMDTWGPAGHRRARPTPLWREAGQDCAAPKGRRRPQAARSFCSAGVPPGPDRSRVHPGARTCLAYGTAYQAHAVPSSQAFAPGAGHSLDAASFPGHAPQQGRCGTLHQPPCFARKKQRGLACCSCKARLWPVPSEAIGPDGRGQNKKEKQYVTE